jgi:hypothetical protein
MDDGRSLFGVAQESRFLLHDLAFLEYFAFLVIWERTGILVSKDYFGGSSSISNPRGNWVQRVYRVLNAPAS